MKKKRILLVDDEPDFVKALAFQLRFEGYEVVEEFSAEKALEKAKDRPDIILLDVMMPFLSGYEVCSRLRKESETRDIPIIMLTSKSETLDKVEGLKAGADDYIAKSVDIQELVARIEAIVRRREYSVIAEKDKVVLFEELREIMKRSALHILAQPIVHLETKKAIGHELFTRGPQNTQLEDPVVLFHIAKECGLLLDLEIIVRKKTISVASEKLKESLMFINTDPSLIFSPNFDRIAGLYDNPYQIVLEITERTEIPDFQIFSERLGFYKTKGFRFSIDDMGMGFSSLEAMVELQPDFVKIDMCLTRGIGSNRTKRGIVEMIASVCKDSSICVISEGIETEEELRILMDIGVEYGQGYLLGRPEKIS